MSEQGPVKLPPAVAALLASLGERGHDAHLVGPCVRALLEGESVRDFEIATSAGARALLALFPTAIPLDSAGRRLMVPTANGPVDLVPHAHGAGITGELAHRDFTLRALAVDAAGRVADPFGGRADALAKRLRCVGRAEDRLAEDPLRALRALRLVATHDLAPDASLHGALAGAAAGLAAAAAAPLRAELHALLLGKAAPRGLELLRRSGLEAVVAQGVAEDAPRVVGALPLDLELRLAGWLRGTRVVRILRRLREPRSRVVAIERLLHLHPIDAFARSAPEARARRLSRRSAALLPGLLALREAEIAAREEGAEARQRFERARRALERACQPEREGPVEVLALDGRAVMEVLGCGPGPEVGRALAHLAKAVEVDPSCNTTALLRERLLAWHSGHAAH